MQLSTVELVIGKLAPLGFREESRNRYRGPSPLRQGSDSDAFVLTIVDDEHGAYFDHVTEEGGTLYDLAGALGIPTPTERGDEQMPAPSDLKSYAEAHGVAVDVFKAAGWEECEHKGRPALRFATENGYRWRFLDGEKPKYINPSGYERCWYGMQRAVRMAAESGQPLIICNGEASTVAAQHFGVAACAITSGEQAAIPEGLLVDLWQKWQGDVVVAFDSDKAGRTKGPALATALRENGWPSARAIDLGGGKDGYDLADFVATHGAKSTDVLGTLSLVQSELQQSLAKSEHHEFTLFSMVDMWDQQASIQRAWGGWMLMSNITLIGGVSNVGKSPLLLAMVAGYLRGVWPDGTPVPEEMAGRSVVYVLPEGYGEQTEILAEWGFSRQDLAERVFVAALPTPGAPNEPTYTFKLDQGKGMEALHWYCEQVQPGLIVIDGLRAAMTGEESASGDVDRFYAPIGALTRKFGAATIISHHLTKGSETASRDGLLPSMDWFRGSGHITAIPRSAWIVDQPDPNQMELRRLTLVKSAAGPKGQTMAFRMADPADGLHWEAEAPMPPARSKKETAKRFILHMLRRNGVLTHDELWELSQTEGFEMSKATFRDARVDLSNEGKIVHSAKGVGGDYVVKWALPGPPDPIDYDDVVF